MNPINAFVLLATLSLPLAACSDEVLLKNARPRVTWVASEYDPGDDAARLIVWIADIEGDPVDLTISANGSGPIALMPGSYPLDGRSTREFVNDPNGGPNEVRWALSDSTPDGGVVLTLIVDDTPDDKKAGDSYTVTLDPRADNEPVEATPSN